MFSTPVLLTNIRHEQKIFLDTNTLAYFKGDVF
jgi:hypothetical protein